ncbi:uncharacterized protein [Rutidosis leptorrhynchoides]|uniref:uncharacterized protein n=1 Tax=Rutidosis leptorrhynchoides TaxID=125765 RepID=UPI003A9A2FF6
MSDKPLVISCKVANTGITIMKIHVDTGSSIDLIYEQCFRKFPECIKTELKATAISLSGFAASRYNMLLGRSALRKLGILPSTIHGMVKFTTCKGVATIKSMTVQPICAAISTQGAVVEHNTAEDNMCEQDMTGVPREIAEHRLNANPALKPIVQKCRGMAPDLMKWLCGEVTKLVKAGILREVKYQTWVVNPVLVKKA